MAIRLRVVNGRLVALCAARSVEKPGDVYLDDSQHYALMLKFSRDTQESFGYPMPSDPEDRAIVEQEESNNPNRKDWDRVYGQQKDTETEV
jgi:hypothetical protein